MPTKVHVVRLNLQPCARPLQIQSTSTTHNCAKLCFGRLSALLHTGNQPWGKEPLNYVVLLQYGCLCSSNDLFCVSDSSFSFTLWKWHVASKISNLSIR
jgi:hypothetical protein